MQFLPLALAALLAGPALAIPAVNGARWQPSEECQYCNDLCANEGWYYQRCFTYCAKSIKATCQLPFGPLPTQSNIAITPPEATSTSVKEHTGPSPAVTRLPTV